MLRIAFTIFLAVTAWIHPATAFASIAEPQLENPTFINYEQFRKTTPLQQLLPETSIPSNDKQLVRRNHAPESNTNRSSENFSGRNYTKEEVQNLIRKYSTEYGINPEAPLCIAKLESGYNQFSKNKSSSASGVFQYLAGTWKATDEGRIGRNIFDADANVKAAIKYMSSRGNAKPWVVASKCPSVTKIN